ncbi:acylphosphatase [Pseudogracilibacillus sp. ICA-222130]|uniref:acylphosphatase n=1 Tax=Pseudogracilibacillus sp. ICA-222130 TaxID=3134655 RepID=UPI0030BD48CB
MKNFDNVIVENVRAINLNAYLIALEGWRRGITIKWYDECHSFPTKNNENRQQRLGNIFSLTLQERTHFFYQAYGDQIQDHLREMLQDKQELREQLTRANYSVLQNKSFSSTIKDEKLLDYSEQINYPIVFKIMNKKVSFICEDEQELLYAIEKWRSVSTGSCYIEQYLQGNNYQLYIVKNEIVGALKRAPIYIIGDGEKTIKELITEKNIQRKNNPSMKKNMIKINKELKYSLMKNGYCIDDILQHGEKVYLFGKENITYADSVEALSMIPQHAQHTVLSLVRQYEGLTHVGVDIILHENVCTIVDIDTNPDISKYVFPVVGEPVHITKFIIDAYFPKTTHTQTNPYLYFNYGLVRKQLTEGTMQSIELSQKPIDPFAMRQYIVYGKVQKVSYRKWIQKEARKKRLHGYARNLKNGNVEIIVGGEKKDVEDFKQICEKGSPRSNVTHVIEKEWNVPIPTGFIIKKSEK